MYEGPEKSIVKVKKTLNNLVPEIFKCKSVAYYFGTAVWTEIKICW